MRIYLNLSDQFLVYAFETTASYYQKKNNNRKYNEHKTVKNVLI